MFQIQEFKNGLYLCRSQHQCSVSGVFRPPVDGLYSFTFYGIVHGHNGGTVSIKSGNDIICKAWLQYQTWHATGTCTGIVKLTGGHSVRVTGVSSDTSTINLGYSGFTGHLLFQVWNWKFMFCIWKVLNKSIQLIAVMSLCFNNPRSWKNKNTRQTSYQGSHDFS